MGHSFIDYRLNYRAAFEVVGPDDGTLELRTLLNVVGGWIAGRAEVDAQQFQQPWFYEEGGDWENASQPGSFVRVKTLPASAGASGLDGWAVAWEHPDGHTKGREWRTEIGIRPADRGYAVSIANGYRYKTGWVGEEREPNPSCPAVVHSFVDSPNWSARAGDLHLSKDPIYLQAEDVAAFALLLRSQEVEIPFVLVSKRDDGTTNVSAQRLSKRLAGVAVVFETATSEVGSALQDRLPEEYRCSRGNVRIYYPPIRPKVPRDYLRHRFFAPSAFDLRTAQEVESLIAESLLRRSPYVLPGRQFGISEIEAEQRARRLAVLRSRQGEAEKTQWIELLEDVNHSLEAQAQSLKDENATLKKAVLDEKSNVEILEGLNDDLNRNLGEQRHFAIQETTRANAASRLADELTATTVGMSEMPDSVAEIARFITTVHSRTISFTEEAWRSAEDAQINNHKSDMNKVWSCLYHIATTLHRLMGENKDTTAIMAEFRAASGLELAFSEGSQTNKDKKFAALRNRVVDGQDLDITPHVKIGSKPSRLLRVHFAYHCGRIVVGHCGDHLDTYGTQHIN